MNNIRACLFAFGTFLLLLTVPASAAPPDTDTIPSGLEQWKPWVLHGMEERFCPTAYNDGDANQCVWPSRLNFNLEKDKGRFVQQWLVFVDAWVPLPGGSELWPREVRVDGKPVPVLGKKELPLVRLTPGTHTVEGLFVWREMPEIICVPEQSGLIALAIDGNPVKFPLIDTSGRLWVKKKDEAGRKEDRVEFRVFRLLDDTIPMQVTTLVKIDISGQAREIVLEGVLLDKAVPMKVESPLPVRLGPKGELMIQGRPGFWQIKILPRLEGPVLRIRPLNLIGKQEIWSFQSQNHLRMVKIEGVPSVDPKQTDLPAEWRKFPAYIIQPGSEMIFEQMRRGDPDPAPDRLELTRTWWLDFDGDAFTIQDRINGTMSRQWYLAMNPPDVPGRVSVDGIDQLITSHGKDKKPGVELRKGRFQLVAESRCEAATRRIPAVGWDHDFQCVSGVLNLPPGWRLLTASGADVVAGTWFDRWTLLDLFLVLIISMTILKLRGWRWGLLALVALGLTYHEPGAPRIVWLNLLAALALLRFLPDGLAKKLVNLWRWGSVVTLLVIAIPFIVGQVRCGVYPQLERHQAGPGLARLSLSEKATRSPLEAEKRPSVDKRVGSDYKRKRIQSFMSGEMQQKGRYYQKEAVLTLDPAALVQTGPGLPAWRWRSVVLKWNGPVVRDQQIRLWLLSPFANLILALLRSVLLALLAFCLIDFRHWKAPNKKAVVSSAMVFLFLFPAAASAKNDIAGYPRPELLEQLQKRLLERPDCLPNCAESPRMHLSASLEQLRILFSVHAAVETAVPLPGSLTSWLPKQVLVNNQPAQGLFRDKEGILWVHLPQGIHTVTVIGNVPAGRSFQIPLPLRPRHATVESTGWRVEGMRNDGQVEASIRLTRLAKNGAKDLAASEATIAPFFHIERVLSLGLNWQVRTKLTRMTPEGTPIMVSVPLIDGESVTTEGIRVENGHALIHMDPEMREVVWISTLKKSSVIEMKAPEAVPWTETWALDASPVWHCELSGIPVIHHEDREGYWKPRWQPWPGERVTISISRPKALSGKLLTIDEAKLDLTPGKRFTKASISMNLRSSKGGQHQMALPAGARLMQVKINGKSQPIRQEAGKILIPLQPGGQTIYVEWLQQAQSGLVTRAPLVSIGPEAVNVGVIFHMPQSRWLLWTARARLGPAVLFWTYLLVVVLAALCLGTITWTPLKRRHWFLLGLGLTQVQPVMAILVVGWLFALGLRKKRSPLPQTFYFNMTQVLLVFWTVAALMCLYLSVHAGLLGIPRMQISGNGSSDFLLHWTYDRIGSTMPQPWVLSVPLLVFRILMLFWALWLAHSLLKWLRWGWHCFSEGGLWRKISWRRRKPSPPPLPSGEKVEEGTPQS